MNTFIKLLNIIYIIIVIVIVLAVAYFAFQNFFGNQNIQSKQGLFQITAPRKLGLEENRLLNKDEYELAIYDIENSIYIFATVSEKVDSLNDTVLLTTEQMKTDEVYQNVTEIEETQINGLKAYISSYEYTDNNEIEFFAKNIWIEGNKYAYYLILECPLTTKGELEEYLNNIGNSFVEL